MGTDPGWSGFERGREEVEAMGVDRSIEELFCERENGEIGRGSWEKLELVCWE